MACKNVSRGECLGVACTELSGFIGNLESFYYGSEGELDRLESEIIADCQVKRGCNAQQIRERGLDFGTVALNAGDLAARVRRQKVGGER